jgi:uncharacterized protein (DUF433 family)
MVSEGMTEAENLKAYPDLEREDLREALRDMPPRLSGSESSRFVNSDSF